MEEIRLQVVYYTNNYGNKVIVSITNDVNKWLKYNNSFRDEYDYETLETFDIKPIDYIKF